MGGSGSESRNGNAMENSKTVAARNAMWAERYESRSSYVPMQHSSTAGIP
jgi:hypothetical protein